MEYVTVSAKIPRKLKKLLDEYNIKPGPIIRKALKEEVKKHVLDSIEKRAKKLSKRLPEISDEEIAKIIREDRSGR